MAKDSAYTSTRQIPAAYTCEDLAPVYGAGHNIDYGGGRFDDATEFLMHHYVCKNSVYDPYNRTPEHNSRVLKDIANGATPPYSLSILNVLNVITDRRERWEVINKAMSYASQFKTLQVVVIQVYEGNRTGVPSKAPRTQMNQPAAFYKKEILDAAPYGWSMSPKMYGDKKNIYLLTRKEGNTMTALKATTTAKKTKTTKKSQDSATASEVKALKASFAELSIKRELAAQLDRMFVLASPCGMAATHVQVFMLKGGQGKTKALARVILNDCLQLTGLRVVDGQSGLFVAYPNDPNNKGDDYRSLFYPLTKELREHIEQQVLIKYQEALASGKVVV